MKINITLNNDCNFIYLFMYNQDIEYALWLFLKYTFVPFEDKVLLYIPGWSGACFVD